MSRIPLHLLSALGVLWCQACIGRSLVDDDDLAGQDIMCPQPAPAQCAHLRDPVPALDISSDAFASTEAQRTCAQHSERRTLGDGASLQALVVDCQRLELALDAGAVAVLDAPVFRDATLHVVGSGNAVLIVRDATGSGIALTTAGQVATQLRDPALEDLRVVIGADTFGQAFTLEGGAVEGFSLRGGAHAELRADDTRLTSGAIDVGRLTLESATLVSEQLLTDDLLCVDGDLESCVVSPFTGAIYETTLTDSALVGCADLTLAGSTVFGGYVQGCSHGPLHLVSTTVSGYQDADWGRMVRVVGPIEASAGSFSFALVGGDGYARGLSLDNFLIGSSVICDPRVVNVDGFTLSCSVCAEDSPFEVCAPPMSTIDLSFSDCAPFAPPACMGSRSLLDLGRPELPSGRQVDADIDADADAGTGG